MPRYRRYFIPNSAVFLTLVTSERKPIFSNNDVIAFALKILRNVKQLHSFRMKGYVVLPDHWHLIIWIRDGRFDKVVHSFKRAFVQEYGEEYAYTQEIWQKRYYDHVIRNEEDFSKHLDYVHYNPVHHKYVTLPMDYPYSSVGYYVQKGWYSPEWGRAAVASIKDMDLD